MLGELNQEMLSRGGDIALKTICSLSREKEEGVLGRESIKGKNDIV